MNGNVIAGIKIMRPTTHINFSTMGELPIKSLPNFMSSLHFESRPNSLHQADKLH